MARKKGKTTGRKSKNNTRVGKIKRKPSICFVNPPVLIKRPISELIARLGEKGYKTSLLIPKKLFRQRDDSLHHSGNMAKSRVYSYSTLNLPFSSSEQPLPVTPMICINTFRAMKKNDIIHMWVPYYLTSFWVLLIKRIFFPGKKMFLTMDTVPGYSFSMGGFWDAVFKIYNKLFGWLLFGTPDKIILYGRSMISYALRAGVPKEKIKVIPTGINIPRINKREKETNRKEIRKELEISRDAKIVLYAGLLVPRKGIGKIIQIAEKMRKEKVVFVLAGNGPKRKQYKRKVEKLGLKDKIRFLGWRKDIHKLYQASDVLLLPSEGEGLPGVVMEAMSHGLPVVASRIPCIPDLIEDGKSGYLCGKDDIPAFSKKIKAILINNHLAKDFADKEIHIIKKYNWKKIANQYQKLYSDKT